MTTAASNDLPAPQTRDYSRSEIASPVSILPVLPIVLVFYSFLLIPPEVRLNVAGVALPSYRLAIISLLFFAVKRLVDGRIRIRICLPDLLVLVSAFWLNLSFMVHYGPAIGLVRASGVAIDTFGAYFIARASVASIRDLRVLLVLAVPGLLFAGLVMLTESLSHRILLRELATAIFGPLTAYSSGNEAGTLSLNPEVRLGLTRAFGPFSHPILGGVILASALALYVMSGLRAWPRPLGIAAALMGFFSLSSAAIIALGLGIGALGIDRLKGPFRGLSWWVIIGFGIFTAILIEVVANRGLLAVLLRLTLDPHTAYFRLAIWEHSLNSVANYPLFGIGYESYARPIWMGPNDSIDAHFLALAVRQGVVSPLCLMAALVYSMIKLGRATARMPKNDHKLLVGLNISMGILFFGSMTVMYFSEAQVWLMSILAFCVSLSTNTQGEQSGALPVRA